MITKLTLKQYLLQNPPKKPEYPLATLHLAATFIHHLKTDWFYFSAYDLAEMCALYENDYPPSNITYKDHPLPPLQIDPLFKTPHFWIYFHHSLPQVKKYFTFHKTIHLQSASNKLWQKLTSQKTTIKTQDIAALKLLLEENKKLLHKFSRPNHGKILVYFPPKYLSDQAITTAKEHKTHLTSNLTPTFDENGRLKKELISEEIKSNDAKNTILYTKTKS